MGWTLFFICLYFSFFSISSFLMFFKSWFSSIIHGGQSYVTINYTKSCQLLVKCLSGFDHDGVVRKFKVTFVLSHRRSTTLSLETYPLNLKVTDRSVLMVRLGFRLVLLIFVSYWSIYSFVLGHKTFFIVFLTLPFTSQAKRTIQRWLAVKSRQQLSQRSGEPAYCRIA